MNGMAHHRIHNSMPLYYILNPLILFPYSILILSSHSLFAFPDFSNLQVTQPKFVNVSDPRQLRYSSRPLHAYRFYQRNIWWII